MKCSIPLSVLFLFSLSTSTLVSSSFVDVETDAGSDEKMKRALMAAGQEGPSLRGQRMLAKAEKEQSVSTKTAKRMLKAGSVMTKAEKEATTDAEAEKEQSVSTKTAKRMLRTD